MGWEQVGVTLFALDSIQRRGKRRVRPLSGVVVQPVGLHAEEEKGNKEEWNGHGWMWLDVVGWEVIVLGCTWLCLAVLG